MLKSVQIVSLVGEKHPDVAEKVDLRMCIGCQMEVD